MRADHDTVHTMKAPVTLEHTNIKLAHTHSAAKCSGRPCTIHNRSNHHMRHLPQHWRDDRGIMERTCEHGVGHPDPDEIASDTIHGCDGCCTPHNNT